MTPSALAGLLADAGLADVVVSELAGARCAPPPSTSGGRGRRALAGPLAKLLAALPEDAAQALRARVREAAGPYETPDGLEFPGVTLLAAGRRG